LFAPSIEPPGNSAFISTNVLQQFSNGDYNRVPYMTGHNDADGYARYFRKVLINLKTLLLFNSLQLSYLVI
jgi:hypothetical protein